MDPRCVEPLSGGSWQGALCWYFVRDDQPSIDRTVPEVSSKPLDAPDVCPTSEPALRAIAMPADTNPHGDIFGGWLLCQMDLAGSTFATRHANGRVVTVAITAMAFHRPVMVGDEVTCFCNVEKTGNTSITVKIESWVRRRLETTSIKVTEGVFTYVRVGSDGRPKSVADPPEV
jgi:acyl-CoA thioesterase YciA